MSLYETQDYAFHGTATCTLSPPLCLSLSHFRRTAALMSSPTDTTGMMQWAGGVLLSNLLCAHPTFLPSKSVVELGCGSALLSCVASALGCKSVVATDGQSSVLSLAALNLSQPSSRAAAAPTTALLRWGETPLPACLSPHTTDLALAAEVFYHHKGGGQIQGIEEQATALFSTALRQLLRPCTCPSPACSAGLLLLTYTPRYPGMARALRTASARLQLHLQPLHRACALTPELRATNNFTDTRLLAVCACAAALQGHLAALGSPQAAPRSEDSDWEEGELQDREEQGAEVGHGMESSLFS